MYTLFMHNRYTFGLLLRKATFCAMLMLYGVVHTGLDIVKPLDIVWINKKAYHIVWISLEVLIASKSHVLKWVPFNAYKNEPCPL